MAIQTTIKKREKMITIDIDQNKESREARREFIQGCHLLLLKYYTQTGRTNMAPDELKFTASLYRVVNATIKDERMSKIVQDVISANEEKQSNIIFFSEVAKKLRVKK